MILVAGSFHLPPGRRNQAKAAMERVIAASRVESGCIVYAYAEDVLEPGLYRVSELWDNREALTAHFASPHMERWRLEREALGMSDRDIAAYTVSTGEVL